MKRFPDLFFAPAFSATPLPPPLPPLPSPLAPCSFLLPFPSLGRVFYLLREHTILLAFKQRKGERERKRGGQVEKGEEDKEREKIAKVCKRVYG